MTNSSSTNNMYAGLQKWSLTNSVWHLDYILTNGLNIGQSYMVTGTNNAIAGTYTTSTDGLRQLSGQTNADGTVSLYALSSTASTQDGINNAKDSGVDPNKLFLITDNLAETNAANVTGETFSNIASASYGQIYRGVSFTPQAVPEPSTWAFVVLSTLAGGLVVVRNRKQNS